MYAIIMATLGAGIGNFREGQPMLGVFLMMPMLSAYPGCFLFAIPEASNSFFIRFLSYFPFTAPMIMIIRLAVGDVVKTPPLLQLQKAYPDLCPKPRQAATAGPRFASTSGRSVTGQTAGRSYEVQEGDTLFDIARYEMGNGSRWIEIFELNKQLLTEDYDYLKPGMKLVLPARRGPQERLAREPSRPVR